MSNLGVNFVTVRINSDKCTRCMECIQVCPTGALQYEAPVCFVHNAYECSYCEVCMDVCEAEAIKIMEM